MKTKLLKILEKPILLIANAPLHLKNAQALNLQPKFQLNLINVNNK